MTIKESGEMYLETILILSKKSVNVRAVDVAEYMGYSKPSVSRAVHLLEGKGYLSVGAGGVLALTNSGRVVAETIYDRHNTIARLLISIGVNEKTAVEDACRVEHYISEETFAALKKYVADIPSDAHPAQA